MKFLKWLFRKKKITLHHRSTHHDLPAIYQRVNTEYFEGKVNLPFTWFGSQTRRPRVCFRFGLYNLQTGRVMVHRMLDDPSVPEYCVAFILYHEMLHHLMPPLKGRRGRRQIHHPAFVAKEKKFRDYALAQDFLIKMSSKKSFLSSS